MNKKDIDSHIPKHWKNLFEDVMFSSLINTPIQFITEEIKKDIEISNLLEE